jgi:hypothetical protein
MTCEKLSLERMQPTSKHSRSGDRAHANSRLGCSPLPASIVLTLATCPPGVIFTDAFSALLSTFLHGSAPRLALADAGIS